MYVEINTIIYFGNVLINTEFESFFKNNTIRSERIFGL